MSQALRKLTGAINQSKCIVVFINQLREKVGVMFGNPETTTGGRSLKFYASMRIEVRRIESIKEAGDVVGNRVRAKFVKNKVAPPFTEAEFEISFGTGIDRLSELVDLGVEYGLLNKSGAWYAKLDGTKIGQGKQNTKKYFKEHPEEEEALRNEVYAKFKNNEESEEILEKPLDE
jgi:recombination protein RecA